MTTEPDATLSAAVVRPGDTLILVYQRHISTAEAVAIKGRVAASLPGVEAAIIGGAASVAVYRPHNAAGPAQALRQIWARLEESDEAISAAWLRRVIAESGARNGG